MIPKLQPVVQKPESSRRANSPGHSRTLYTSIGPDQSNFIRKKRGHEKPCNACSKPNRKGA
jgi:hypothetical protein